MSKWVITILFLIGSAILNHWIPFSSFFRNVDTMVHEFGHAIITLLLSGRVLYIYLFENHSGVTYSYITADWRLIPVALVGYLTASLFAVFLFYMHRQGKQRWGLAVTTGIAAVSLVLFVRNEFGVYWLIGFIIVNVIAWLIPASWLRSFYYLIVAFISLEESVVGPIGLIMASLNNPEKAGDATSLYEVTGFPPIVWAVVFTLFSLWCAKAAIGYFLGARRERRRWKANTRRRQQQVPTYYTPERDPIRTE